MAAKRKDRDVEAARRHLNAARRRLERQQKRVDRQEAEGRDASSARKLLSTFEQRATRARYYLEAMKSWHRKHPYQRIDKRVKGRLLNRKVHDGTKPDKAMQWTDQVD